MKTKIGKYLILPLAILATVVSCESEDVLFNTPFVSLEAVNSSSSGPINSEQEFVGEYAVYINAPAFSENINVQYEVKVGDGLVSGRDYELVSATQSLTFLPGIYDMKIRVKWLKTCVRDEDTDEIISDTLDESKDNTLTITLTECSAGYTLGSPGPSQLKKSITIKKVKAS